MSTQREPDSEATKVLKDIRKLLIAVVLFGILAWAVSALIASQRESEDASRRQGSLYLRGR